MDSIDLIARYRPRGISVTDLSAQLWCEKQLEYSLELGRKRTREMKKGENRHQDLLEEISVLVEVRPKSFEDVIALKLSNSLVGLKQVRDDGRGREIPIFGNVNSLFVVGIIDELCLENGSLKLIDTKTRKSESMPSVQQSRVTKFQMMIYKHLFDSIAGGVFKPKDFLASYKLSKDSRTTEDLQRQAEKLGLVIEPNLSKSADDLFSAIKKMHEISEMEIVYEHQETRKLIGSEKFWFDSEDFRSCCNFVEEFWRGKRSAIPVGEKNSWKCNYCEFKTKCFSKGLDHFVGTVE
jgi:exonuclease V